MSRVDGCGGSRCGPAGPADRAAVPDALRRAFEDRLGEARARLRDGDGGSARRPEPGRPDVARPEPRRPDVAPPDPRRADAERSDAGRCDADRAEPGRGDAARTDARAAGTDRDAADRHAEAHRPETGDGLAGAPGGLPSSPASPGQPATAAPATGGPAGSPATADGEGADTARVGLDPAGRRDTRVVAHWGDGERGGGSGGEGSQAATTPFQVALARAEAARPASDAAAIAQWLIDRMPLADPADRTVTLSFPGSTVPVERIVLVREGGVLHLTVQPRPDGHERVAAGIRALEERLRERGLRVGSVRLS